MGDTFGDGDEDERPVRTVTVADFRLDRTEVSNGAYRACVEAGECLPLAWAEPGSPYDIKDTTAGAKGAAFVGLDGDEQPAVGVTWTQAAAYCAWAGGRLPTEVEWEYAATWHPGASDTLDKRRWPWGDAAPDCTRAHTARCGRETLPVDALPDGSSAWGVIQMAGNVWEWTADPYEGPSDGKRGLGLLQKKRKPELQYVLRGGAFNSSDAAIRPTFRRHAAPAVVEAVHGFRCAYDKE